MTREVSDTYIQNTVTNMLQRYFLLSLTFNLRAFKGMAEEAPAPERGSRGSGAPTDRRRSAKPRCALT
jgi:hypothetical protein